MLTACRCVYTCGIGQRLVSNGVLLCSVEPRTHASRQSTQPASPMNPASTLTTEPPLHLLGLQVPLSVPTQLFDGDSGGLKSGLLNEVSVLSTEPYPQPLSSVRCKANRRVYFEEA